MSDSEMLEFLLNQFQMHSPKMDGQHGWRFRGGCWPWNFAKGPTIRDAVKAAMEEVAKEKREAADEK